MPRSVDDYKSSIFSIDTKKVHAIDQIDFHKQVGEMIYSTLTISSMASSKLQTYLKNMHSQLKIERISSLAKDTRTKALEDKIIKSGYDPNNFKVEKEMIKIKKEDIHSLRKKLKLPTTEHPQTKEITNLEVKKENMFKIIVEHNVQIENMEINMEALLKEKEQFEATCTSCITCTSLA